MSDVTPSPRLDRSLRLEDLILRATAMPLPEVRVAATTEAQGLQANAETHPDQAQTPATTADSLPSAADVDAKVHADPAPGAGHADPLDGSLQATLAAIHDSLDQSGKVSDAAAISAPLQASNTQHPLAHLTGALMPASAESGAEHFAADNPNGTSIADLDPHPTVPALMQPLNEASAAAAAIAEPLVAAVQAPLEITAQTTASLAGLHAADLVSSLASAAPNLTVAVTVPSLNGVGVDTLSGLLPQPITAGLGSTETSQVPQIDHPLLTIPIGLGDDHHDAGAALHAGHALIGSGLI